MMSWLPLLPLLIALTTANYYYWFYPNYWLSANCHIHWNDLFTDCGDCITNRCIAPWNDCCLSR